MVYTDKIQRAIRFSIKTHELHQKQKRKGKDIPYIVHPLTVGMILAAADACEDAIAAGILHDTIEDSLPEKKVTRKELEERFGSIVADIVESVTESEKSLDWVQRKEEALEDIAGFSYESVLVKSADVLSNHTDLLSDYGEMGKAAVERFGAGPEAYLEHGIKVINALIKRWPESPLAPDLELVRGRLDGLYHEFIDAKE
jgi:(p)ppGpp synthase/HD superfamily hydrolase